MAQQFVQLLVNGLITGSILALTGVGASLVFGIQRIANFAHGDYLTIGAYVAFVVNVVFRQNLVVAAASGVLTTAAFALVAHFGLFRPLRGRGTIAISLITVGLGLVIRDAIYLIAGSQVRVYGISQSEVLTLGFVRFSPGQSVALAVALVVAPLTTLFLARTRLGKSMRAVADNRDLAAIAGIDVERMAVYVWILAGGLAGLGGVMLALGQGAFDPNLGVAPLFLIFTTVVLGGIGSAFGVLTAGLAAAVLFSLLLGVPSLRLRTDYLAIVTVAGGEVVRYLALNLQDITGGALGSIGMLGPSKLAQYNTGWDAMLATFSRSLRR